jgi:hypothetical protein
MASKINIPGSTRGQSIVDGGDTEERIKLQARYETQGLTDAEMQRLMDLTQAEARSKPSEPVSILPEEVLSKEDITNQMLAEGGDATQVLQDTMDTATVGSPEADATNDFINSIINITSEELDQAKTGDLLPGETEPGSMDFRLRQGERPSELTRPSLDQREAAFRSGERRSWDPLGAKEPPGTVYYGGQEFTLNSGEADTYGGIEERLKNNLSDIHRKGIAILGTTPRGQTYSDAKKIGKGTNIDGVYTPPPEQSVDVATQQASVVEQKGSNKDGDYEFTLVQALLKGGALAYNPNILKGKHMPSLEYDRVALTVTEALIADRLYLTAKDEMGITEDPDKPGFDMEEGPEKSARQEVLEEIRRLTMGAEVTIASGNNQLGRQIHSEWLRNNPDIPRTKLTRKEADTLGAAYKELYAYLNPDILTREETKYEQSKFKLKDAAVPKLLAGKPYRDAIFYNQPVKPLTSPMVFGTIDQQSDPDFAEFTRVILGDVGQGKITTKEMYKAFRNMAQTGWVVDKRRNKIMLATLLKYLSTQDAMSWEAEIHNLGETKSKEYKAKEAQAFSEIVGDGYSYEEQTGYWVSKDKDKPNIHNSYLYNAEAVLNQGVDKYAQQVQSINESRNQINYFTLSYIGYNQRIVPQQSHFNLVTGKGVRFVIRNPQPAHIKTSKASDDVPIKYRATDSWQEKNLIETYASHLVEGASKKIPRVKYQMLVKETPTLSKWGNILRDKLKNISDKDYELVAEAIANKIPMTDPAWPAEAAQRVANSLDISEHPDLVEAIRSRGSFEGLVFIDNIIDYSNYLDAKLAGKDFTTFVNAYPDGITNGYASTALQMGHEEGARRTGVIRSRNNHTGNLLDDGDVRDVVQRFSVASLSSGWKNFTKPDPSGDSDTSIHLDTLARNLYSTKDLNKSTTMIYGYGMELNSFWLKFRDHINIKLQYDDNVNPGFKRAYDYLTKNKNSEFSGGQMALQNLYSAINMKYSVSLKESLSDEAIQSRRLSRAAAGIFAVLDEEMVIKAPIGTASYGHWVSEGSDAADQTSFNLHVIDRETGLEKKVPRTSVHYNRRRSAAPLKPMGDWDMPGGYAHGQAIPGPIQGIEGGAIVKTATGSSWNKISNAGKGKPFFGSVYDMVVTDMNNHHVVVEEINKNWFNINMDYSFLEELQDAVLTKMKEYNSAKQTMLKEHGDDPISPLEAGYMHFVLGETGLKTLKSGKKVPDIAFSPLTKMLSKVMEEKEGKAWFDQQLGAARSMHAAMKKVGFNYDIHKPGYRLPPLDVFAQETTVKQWCAFVDEYYRLLNFPKRIGEMIVRTNINKKKLAAMMKEEGHVHASGWRGPMEYSQ